MFDQPILQDSFSQWIYSITTGDDKFSPCLIVLLYSSIGVKTQSYGWDYDDDDDDDDDDDNDELFS